MLSDVANTSAVNAKTTNRATATSIEARRSRFGQPNARSGRGQSEPSTWPTPISGPWLAASRLRSLIGSPREVGDDLALEEHERPIGDRLHLLGVARHERGRRPRRGEGLDLAVDVDAGADVDALGRFDEQQHVGVAHQPAGEHDLLLVAAAEHTDRAPEHRRRRPATLPAARATCSRSRRADSSGTKRPSRVFHAEATLMLLRTFSSGNRALSMRLSGTMPIACAVRRAVATACGRRRCGSSPASTRGVAADDAGQLGVAGSHRPVQRDDLAAAAPRRVSARGQTRVRSPSTATWTSPAVAVASPRRTPPRRAGRASAPPAAPGHRRRCTPCVDDAAVAQHGDGVAELEHLAVAVADEDRRRRPRAATERIANSRAASSALSAAVGSSNTSTRGPAASAPWRSRRAGAAPASARRRALDSGMSPTISAPRARRAISSPAPSSIAPRLRDLPSERDVLGHREVGEQAEVLVDDADPVVVGVGGRRRGGSRSPSELDRPVVGRLVAGEDLEQRRLAGAVLPDQPVDRSARHVQRRSGEGHRSRRSACARRS